MAYPACTNCGKEHPDYDWRSGSLAWWTLNGYYGIWGMFCPECYELVSHDSYGKPNHPEEYTAIAVKQRIQRANRRY